MKAGVRNKQDCLKDSSHKTRSHFPVREIAHSSRCEATRSGQVLLVGLGERAIARSGLRSDHVVLLPSRSRFRSQYRLIRGVTKALALGCYQADSEARRAKQIARSGDVTLLGRVRFCWWGCVKER